MTETGRDLEWLEGDYAICRLDPHARLGAMPGGPFFTMTRTADELSLVCLAAETPAECHFEGPYALLRVIGPMSLGLTGILASILNPLAAGSVPIFALSTFDTDYLLIRTGDRERAEAVLVDAGHRFVAAEDAPVP